MPNRVFVKYVRVCERVCFYKERWEREKEEERERDGWREGVREREREREREGERERERERERKRERQTDRKHAEQFLVQRSVEFQLTQKSGLTDVLIMLQSTYVGLRVRACISALICMYVYVRLCACFCYVPTLKCFGY